jgi:stage II sporulation protein AA (anti-sigma F factor antagonist)
LIGVGRPVDRPLTITGLGREFQIFASVEDALRHRDS